MRAPKPYINPEKTDLHLGDVSTLFGIKPNTLRQYIRRGTIPDPTIRRDPELGWDAATIYLWAYQTGRMPLNAVPFRYLRQVIDMGEIPGPPVPRVHQVTGVTHGLSNEGLGIEVDYGGLTEEALAFKLYYPDEFGRVRADEDRPDIDTVVKVTGHVSTQAGFYVDVHQKHPDFDYKLDMEVYTRDVALLVQEPIPYWPIELRTAFGGIDYQTRHIAPMEGATALPSRISFTGGLAVEAFADDPRNAQHEDLLAALRADVADDYRQAAKHAERHIMDYVKPRQATTWTLSDPKHHLFLAATPAPQLDETPQEESVRDRLPGLVWETPTGDTPTAQQVAMRYVRLGEHNVFRRGNETRAQKAFHAGLVPVPPEEATLVHLSHLHPKLGRPSETGRSFWRDLTSGALVTIYEEARGSLGYCCYTMPGEYPEPVEISQFDFEDQREPFIWSTNRAALPFPRDRDSGYALGYGGTGPHAVKDMAARLLGLASNVPCPRWPFFREGYPTHVSAEEMSGFYTGGER